MYWAALTVVLLVPDPLALLGLQRNPWPFSSDRGIHFSLFLGLTLLADMCRWAIRPRWFIGLLVAYATATELLQAFVPPRTVDLADLSENLLGVAAGTVIFWVAHGRFHAGRACRHETPAGPGSRS
jgi:hypothetical protein